MTIDPKTRPLPSPFWSRHLRREVQYMLDLAVLVAAFFFAYLLRFDFSVPLEYRERALIQLPVVILLQFTIVLLTGVYTFVWRYIGMAEIRTFLHGAFYSAAPLLLLRFGLPEQYSYWKIPLSVILMNTIFAFGGMLALRVLRRAVYERYERNRREAGNGDQRRKPVLLIGAGRAGVTAAREVQSRGDLQLKIVGFLDDDPRKAGSVIQGIRVLGRTEDLPQLAARHQVEEAIITIVDADSATIRRIVETCERARVRVRITPGLYEILDGRVSVSRFRDIQIEDLLGRAPVRLDQEALRAFLTGKVVLVSGAGGSIGSELCRQAARFNPLKLVLVERAEGALFEIHRELHHLWPELELAPIVADVADEARVKRVLTENRVQVLLHAAAHKHVPMMEGNAEEAVKNNVLATERLGRLAGELGVEAFVLISTDKAIRPASVMGATKRVAELVIQALDEEFPRTRFLAVRFGNVLGSAGSVVPIFRQQIEQGGPLTVTHPEATRFFMTIPEAAQLVLQAGAIGGGGEIMVLDMGQPVKILDLAKDMITLSGHRPFDDIEIQFTGLRPGEKLREELELAEEETDHTRHPKIFVGRLKSLPPERLRGGLERLAKVAADGSSSEIRRILQELLPEAELITPVRAAAGSPDPGIPAAR